MKTGNGKMEKLYKKAIGYVKENRTWSLAQEELTLDWMDKYNEPLDQVSSYIANEIYDLMVDFSLKNNLPERWWREFGNEENIFLSFGKKHTSNKKHTIMKKENIELNAHGEPRKKTKSGEYIFRPGRPISNPGKLVSLRIHPDLHDWLNAQGNKTDYINSLIRKDMEDKQ